MANKHDKLRSKPWFSVLVHCARDLRPDAMCDTFRIRVHISVQ